MSVVRGQKDMKDHCIFSEKKVETVRVRGEIEDCPIQQWYEH